MKTARILFLIVSTMFVCIGLLHTWVHFSELISPLYESKLSTIEPLPLTGTMATPWSLWQGFSLMMGIGLIMIGLLNWAYLRSVYAPPTPPFSVLLLMVGFLLVVIYSGFAFFGMRQVYGGILGISLLIWAGIAKKMA